MKFWIYCLITLSASRLGPALLTSGRVIWNVGQGQWVTMAQGDTCYHFDMGGEFFPWTRLQALCGHRQNKVLLSHWDWDHIGALAQRKLQKSLPNICILQRPLGKSSVRKMTLLKRFKDCGVPHDLMTENLPAKLFSWQPHGDFRNSNDLSQVFEFQNFLMPGDSPKYQERTWKNQTWLPSTRILVLGHHGSRTSTSRELLDRLPHLQMSVSSARWKRYGHPHPETVVQLRASRVPLLRTEDWGNIWIQ